MTISVSMLSFVLVIEILYFLLVMDSIVKAVIGCASTVSFLVRLLAAALKT